MCSEIWKPIPGFEDLYEASSDGQIRSIKNGKVHVLKTRTTEKGYVTASLRKGSKQYSRTVNRLVALAFYGEPADPSHHACHNDGNRLNNHVDNIRWDTPAGNEADKVVHGTQWQANKTHCPQGHEYTPENTGRTKNGRRCLACKKADGDRRYREQRGELFGTRKNAKLTPQIVAEMKQLRDEGLIYREIAERYGVHSTTARLACLGESPAEAA